MKLSHAVLGRAVATLLVLATGGAAHAHAGLPETFSISIRRGHPEDMLVGADFGVLITRDSGATWRWLCAAGVGYNGWRPEHYVWREAGDIVAASGEVLLRSPDGGCSWSKHPYFQGMWVTGLAAHPTDDTILYAITGRANQNNGVFRSGDGGETWTPTPLRRLGLVLNAVRVSPADPRRIYASGDEGGKLKLFRSDDEGASWREFEHPLPELRLPYDLAVIAADPASADGVWVRVSSQAYTHLMRSEDGGATLKPVQVLDEVLINMELSADGQTAWVGTPTKFLRGPATGPLVALEFPWGNACAKRSGNTLFACGSTWAHNWALGRSTDQGTTWEPIFNLYDIQGTHLCPRGTPVRDICPALWPQQAEAIGAPQYPDGGVEEPLPPDAGPGPGTPDAGTSDGGTPPPASPPKSDGCGAGPGNAVPLLALLSTLTLWRRGRRRSET
jgi:photosystem II stability/assembly factor-like uncharacterized protein